MPRRRGSERAIDATHEVLIAIADPKTVSTIPLSIKWRVDPQLDFPTTDLALGIWMVQPVTATNLIQRVLREVEEGRKRQQQTTTRHRLPREVTLAKIKQLYDGDETSAPLDQLEVSLTCVVGELIIQPLEMYCGNNACGVISVHDQEDHRHPSPRCCLHSYGVFRPRGLPWTSGEAIGRAEVGVPAV